MGANDSDVFAFYFILIWNASMKDIQPRKKTNLNFFKIKGVIWLLVGYVFKFEIPTSQSLEAFPSKKPFFEELWFLLKKVPSNFLFI